MNENTPDFSEDGGCSVLCGMMDVTCCKVDGRKGGLSALSGGIMLGVGRDVSELNVG